MQAMITGGALISMCPATFLDRSQLPDKLFACCRSEFAPPNARPRKYWCWDLLNPNHQARCRVLCTAEQPRRQLPVCILRSDTLPVVRRQRLTACGQCGCWSCALLTCCTSPRRCWCISLPTVRPLLCEHAYDVL